MTHDYSTYKRYVCSSCYRQITECTCEHLPWQLLQIDEAIQDHIRILNEKGYYTKACCEGHYNDGVPDNFLQIHLARDGEDIFPPLPNKFQWNHYSILYRYECVKESPVAQETFEQEKAEAARVLLEWVEALDIHPYSIHR